MGKVTARLSEAQPWHPASAVMHQSSGKADGPALLARPCMLICPAMQGQFTIVGLGEALFDIFSDRQVLGGAPLNVAVHAHQLAAPRGGSGVVVSRVGQDELGSRVHQELAGRGMSTTYVQTDPDHPTGRVFVRVDEQGEPAYDIADDAAWDWIQSDPDLTDLAHQCNAVCFGLLSQRHHQSRSSIRRFLTDARQAVRLLDLNLRQGFYDARLFRTACELATAVKLNVEELDILCSAVAAGAGVASGGDDGEPDRKIESLFRRFDFQTIILTRGEQGTIIYTPTNRYEGQPVSYDSQPNADAVGPGDACAAAVLVGQLLRLPTQQIANLANQAGAYVASTQGATPKLPDELLNQFN